MILATTRNSHAGVQRIDAGEHLAARCRGRPDRSHAPQEHRGIQEGVQPAEPLEVNVARHTTDKRTYHHEHGNRTVPREPPHERRAGEESFLAMLVHRVDSSLRRQPNTGDKLRASHTLNARQLQALVGRPAHGRIDSLVLFKHRTWCTNTAVRSLVAHPEQGHLAVGWSAHMDRVQPVCLCVEVTRPRTYAPLT